MYERLVEASERMTEGQKVGAGIVGLAVGVALIAMLTLAPIPSRGLRVLIGLVAVVMMVLGTLSLGTSGATDQIV